MIPIRLEPGIGNVKKNMKTLMRHGYSQSEAYRRAYQYARRHSGKRMEAIHSRSQREQRLR